MCTVTFFPVSESEFILTSNRDEAPGRNTIPPKAYVENGVEVLFPKDEVAGGTWIGVSKHNRLVCLLNGGFTAHDRLEAYRLSRGIIVLDLLTTLDLYATINDYDFDGIEPFTIILVDWFKDLQLYELVWDGVTAHFSEKPLGPQIWSSSLLYASEVKKKRERWFSDFLFENIRPSQTEILQFHKTAGDGTIETDIIMDRGFVKTKSITQFLHLKKDTMRYEDLQTSQIAITPF